MIAQQPNRAAREYVPTKRDGHQTVIRCTCTPGGAELCPVPHNVWLNPRGDAR